ncbi:2-dehydropantoate 2-reductase [Bradyrhizobium lablabi]|uniref:ketopantoate reductase family protein n=1 Tax=Bradyrhizobium lablabi TaxID=722472 RepID=UPI001BA590FF|nr:2-dehydropantoate 2-reductase [Bradyrhizobium lablabi]MBR1121167.1 2-dehydropantoate 2-reductase [Bradyrhizobium lablabi]
MNVAIMGAGAIGCYFGALLARAGHSVVLIGRPVHVEAINKNGLLLETKTFRDYLPARASTDASAIADADLVLFSVKSQDTESAGRSMTSHLKPGATVLSLQNGVDNAERLSEVIGRAVTPTVVYVGTEMAGPGHVRHHGPGELVIGAGPESDKLAALISEAGHPSRVDANVAEILWHKLITNCAYNAMSAVSQLPYGAMVEVEGARDVMRNAVTECAAVARACGVAVPDDIVQRVLTVARNMPSQSSSTAQDLARGKTTEIDYLNGYVVRKGLSLGISTPTNLALQVMVKLRERKLAG